jgi:predicted NAD-dependent protein-ADP-ribosyltransferase YbiA (DUF1768 family)
MHSVARGCARACCARACCACLARAASRMRRSVPAGALAALYAAPDAHRAAQFAPGSELAGLLLATGNRPLVEGNRRNDNFWCVAPVQRPTGRSAAPCVMHSSSACSRELRAARRRGDTAEAEKPSQNMLGVLLMRRRDELREMQAAPEAAAQRARRPECGRGCGCHCCCVLRCRHVARVARRRRMLSAQLARCRRGVTDTMQVVDASRSIVAALQRSASAQRSTQPGGAAARDLLAMLWNAVTET